jgi:hypothetical protein
MNRLNILFLLVTAMTAFDLFRTLRRPRSRQVEWHDNARATTQAVLALCLCRLGSGCFLLRGLHLGNTLAGFAQLASVPENCSARYL